MAAVIPVASLLAACTSAPAPPVAWGATAQAPCDGLDAAGCMLPFPDDYYTTADSSQVTGRRVVFP
ncbi:MAG: hypothetical protein ACYDB3_11280, partial [Acidimicrobiales bacterium]